MNGFLFCFVSSVQIIFDCETSSLFKRFVCLFFCLLLSLLSITSLSFMFGTQQNPVDTNRNSNVYQSVWQEIPDEVLDEFYNQLEYLSFHNIKRHFINYFFNLHFRTLIFYCFFSFSKSLQSDKNLYNLIFLFFLKIIF